MYCTSKDSMSYLINIYVYVKKIPHAYLNSVEFKTSNYQCCSIPLSYLYHRELILSTYSHLPQSKIKCKV
jgi:hypothetical protein